jgi:ABC-type transport system involved in cytochrome bd biosynthesis fused ATPase/permease subunit
VAFVRDLDFIDGTLLENMQIGRADLSSSEAQKLLEQVGLGNVISRLPEGLNLRLRPGGRPLSDSQRILVALARAMACAPRLLLIDKVLDGLDPRESEPILSLLFAPGHSWTLVIATRDQRILERCARVYRLRTGMSATATATSDGPESESGGIS